MRMNMEKNKEKIVISKQENIVHMFNGIFGKTYEQDGVIITDKKYKDRVKRKSKLEALTTNPN